jgi:hypothetical protein
MNLEPLDKQPQKLRSMSSMVFKTIQNQFVIISLITCALFCRFLSLCVRLIIFIQSVFFGLVWVVVAASVRCAVAVCFESLTVNKPLSADLVCAWESPVTRKLSQRLGMSASNSCDGADAVVSFFLGHR